MKLFVFVVSLFYNKHWDYQDHQVDKGGLSWQKAYEKSVCIKANFFAFKWTRQKILNFKKFIISFQNLFISLQEMWVFSVGDISKKLLKSS